jgi:ABC-type antimicrobial peptide transport system permease subunit
VQSRSNGRRPVSQRFSTIYVLGFFHIIAAAALISLPGQRFGISAPGTYPANDVEQLLAILFALLVSFGGTGYAVLQSNHSRRIARTFLAYSLYLAVAGTGLLLIWLTEIGWFAILPLFAVGLVLAISLPRGSSSRTLIRIAVPTLIGGFLISLRNVADAYWSVPTPDWTLTILVSLLLAFWAINKVETGAGRSPQSVDPGPGPIRV